MMRRDARLLILGNWKMHGLSADLAEARAIDSIAADHPALTVGLAPPFTLLLRMVGQTEHLSIGGQTCHDAVQGAYTGQISAAMLAEGGADFVILGHSECRVSPDDNGPRLSAKVQAAQEAGLGIVLCVGESAAQHDAGEAEEAVVAQLAASLPPGDEAAPQLVIAYEPVWAIGAGSVPSPEAVEGVHCAIRSWLAGRYGQAGSAVAILYGGSVNAENVAALLAIEAVDGVLVGGASLSAESFGAIIRAAARG